MALPVVAQEWPWPWRYGAAIAAGVAWTLFGHGLLPLGTPVVWFLVIVAVLVAPVLAALGRNWTDEGALVACAILTAILTSQLLVPAPWSELPILAWDVARAWTSIVALTLVVYALRRRFIRA